MQHAGLQPSATIHEIKEKVIMKEGEDVRCPVDGETGASYVNSVGADPDDVGKADYMLSYTWNYKVEDIVDTLTSFCKSMKANESRIYVWMCWSCINQHRVEKARQAKEVVPFEQFESDFRGRVDEIGHIICMMSPWHSPDYLSRIWCNFEMHTAINHKKDITIVMPPREHDDFLQSMRARSGCTKMWTAFTSIDIDNAQSSVEADKQNILKLVRGATGSKKFNSEVGKYLQQWMVGQYEDMLEECRSKVKKEGVAKVVIVLNDLADLLMRVGCAKKALDRIEEGLALIKERGSEIENAVGMKEMLMTNRSAVKRALGDFRGALRDAVRASTTAREADLRERSSGASADECNRKACLAIEEKDYKAAMELLNKGLAMAMAKGWMSIASIIAQYADAPEAVARILGGFGGFGQTTKVPEGAETVDHTQILELTINKGTCLLRSKDLEGATAAYQEAEVLAREEKLLETPQGSNLLSCLGVVLMTAKDYDSAERVLREAYEVCERTCTLEGEFGGGVCYNLATLSWNRRDAEGALKHWSEAALSFKKVGLEEKAEQAEKMAERAKEKLEKMRRKQK